MGYERSGRTADAAIEYPGTIAEADALGTIDTEEPEYRAKAEEWYARNEGLVRKLREGRINPREQNALLGSSFRLIQNLPEYRNHPERTTEPPRPVLRDLRLAFADALNLATEEELERIKIFTAVGSPPDKHLGIDGFWRIEGPDRWHIPTYVTFDYTVNPEKNRTRADVLIKCLPDPDLDEDEYVKALDAVAAKAAAEYRKKIKAQERHYRAA